MEAADGASGGGALVVSERYQTEKSKRPHWELVKELSKASHLEPGMVLCHVPWKKPGS